MKWALCVKKLALRTSQKIMCQEIIFEYKELQREILGKIKVFVPFLMNLHMKFKYFQYNI